MAARRARFAATLASRYRLPVMLVDERYSSLEAQARLREARQAGLRKRRVAKADVDAAAACVILERWFTKKHEAQMRSQQDSAGGCATSSRSTASPATR
jgi:putative holliday junction resolvase